ncbi:MAG: MBL fold metallo-hydrolase [Candidatus Latescibacterota bacterium]|nr:MBL fold metallo-hydrolase [Candidatus Latescibacterota bacterium]
MPTPPHLRIITPKHWTPLGRELFLNRDSCKINLLRYDKAGLAIDFGTGAWLDHLDELGISRVEHVVLTHAHRDQLCGLYRGRRPACPIHAPAGDRALCETDALRDFWTHYQQNGCPPNYAAPRLPLSAIAFDLSADSETPIGPARFCAIATPGHTADALSYIVEWQGRQLAFCGDAVHAGGTLHQPYHLEWDHWTPAGALAAWYGLERLGYCHFDQLLPSHGPPILKRPRQSVQRTQHNLMAFIRAKGSVCAGEQNRWLDTAPLAGGAHRILPDLYQFGGNSYLLVSAKAGGLVIDPQRPDIHLLKPLLREIGLSAVAATTATHYHCDHCDALDQLRQEYGAAVWLHPLVAEPLADRDRYDVPWLPPESIRPNRLLPEAGIFRFGEYRFAIRPFPGQTWWHCAFDTRIAGRHVLFSGDNFQPPTRWNGTGGFCAFNGSRFQEGFARSAKTALDLAPDIICNGHRIVYRFAPSHYRRILRWSASAARAVRALCPASDSDYDCRLFCFEPFISKARPGGQIALKVVCHNRTDKTRALTVDIAAAKGWRTTLPRRRTKIPPHQRRALSLTVRIPRRATPGRQLIAADCTLDGQLMAEACVAIVDLS